MKSRPINAKKSLKIKDFSGLYLFRSLFMAAELGFEPRHTESESAVLPLHNSAILSFGARFLGGCSNLDIQRLPLVANFWTDACLIYSPARFPSGMHSCCATFTQFRYTSIICFEFCDYASRICQAHYILAQDEWFVK